MLRMINLEVSFRKFRDTYSPKIVAELNGQQIKLVRLEGDRCPWHDHEHEDEMFLVLDGMLEIHDRDGKVTLHAGEFCVVPKGTEHRVVPHGHVRLVLFEPAGIAHTGTVRSEITRDSFDRLDP
ncbi:MAG: cupin domain-containing protein [Candidatus Eisenbacteria bacterium]